jgi:hypothetical protein
LRVALVTLAVLWRMRTSTANPKPGVAPTVTVAIDPDHRGTRDAEAYRLYMMGLTLLRGRGTNRNPKRAGQLYAGALARGPEFAQEQTGLALGVS